jgi:putative ABC transport system permease protein
MLEGQNFTDMESGDKWSFILNEAALKMFGYEKGVGHEFTYWGNRTGRIVGVTENFNFRSLHHEIAPCAIVLTDYCSHISLRIQSPNIPATLNYIEETWKQFAANVPFAYYFLNEDIDKLYKSEIAISQVLKYFTILAIIISCLGLFGLAAFMTQQRTKEIGIRKTLGASTTNVFIILTADTTKWILFANIIAWPVAWFSMRHWLDNFAYRIELDLWPFLFSGFFAVFVAFVAVSWQAIRAAHANPVDTIRTE